MREIMQTWREIMQTWRDNTNQVKILKLHTSSNSTIQAQLPHTCSPHCRQAGFSTGQQLGLVHQSTRCIAACQPSSSTIQAAAYLQPSLPASKLHNRPTVGPSAPFNTPQGTPPKQQRRVNAQLLLTCSPHCRQAGCLKTS